MGFTLAYSAGFTLACFAGDVLQSRGCSLLSSSLLVMTIIRL